MDFNLSKEHLEVQERARKFVEERVLPGVIERDQNSIYPMEQYQEMVKAGFVGFQFDKKYGGLGKDYMSYILTIEELGKVDASLCVLYSVSLSLFLGGILKYGTEEQKKFFIGGVADGSITGCFALTEKNAGSDASGVQTVAVRDGDNYIINGSKRFITNGKTADYAMIVAKTDVDAPGTKGLTSFMVPTNTPGYEVVGLEDKMGLRSAEVAELKFTDMVVPVSARLGEEGDGFKLAMETLNGGRVGVAAQALGIAKGAYAHAIEFLKRREQFGKPLYKNQYLAFKAVDLRNIIDQAELMLYKAAWLEDQGIQDPKACAQAKLLCSDAAMAVTTEAIQLMGGEGYMKEFHVERMMRDAKITQIYEGTNEIQRMVIQGPIFR